MRIRRRILRVTANPVRVKEAASVELPQGAPAVWSFMWDPASCVKLFETTEIGVTLPGSPKGVGEIQVTVDRTDHGRVGNLHEVVEVEPGRRAVTRSLVSGCPSWGALTIESLRPDACRLTQEFWADIPAGVPVETVHQLHDDYKKMLGVMMRRLAELAVDPLT